MKVSKKGGGWRVEVGLLERVDDGKKEGKKRGEAEIQLPIRTKGFIVFGGPCVETGVAGAAHAMRIREREIDTWTATAAEEAAIARRDLVHCAPTASENTPTTSLPQQCRAA